MPAAGEWTMNMTPLESAMTAALTRWSEGDNPDIFDLVKAYELLRGYDARWLTAGLKPIGVEVEFDMPLINPETGAASRTYRLAGKIDALAYDADGRVLVIEHKSTVMDMSAGSEYWLRLRLDRQVSIYIEAASRMGHDVAGCLYDVAKRPTMKPRKATPEESRKFTKGKGCKGCGGSAGGKLGVVQGKGRIRYETHDDGAAKSLHCDTCNGTGWKDAPRLHSTMREDDETSDEYQARVRDHIADNPDAYYRRGTIVRLDSEREESQWDVWQTARMIRDAELAGRHVRNDGACVQYGSTCEYFDVCTGAESIDNDHRFRSSEANPELDGCGNLPMITASRLRAWNSCARLHHYRYGIRRRPLTSSYAARFGTLFHHGLEAWWNALATA